MAAEREGLGRRSEGGLSGRRTIEGGGVGGRSAPELRFIVGGDTKKDGTGGKDGAAKSR